MRIDGELLKFLLFALILIGAMVALSVFTTLATGWCIFIPIAAVVAWLIMTAD